MSPSAPLRPSAFRRSVFIDGPHLDQRRQRHPWSLPLICLVAGLLAGWLLRGLFN